MTIYTPPFNPFEKLPTLEEARSLGISRFHDPNTYQTWLDAMMRRDAFIAEYGFSVPCLEAIDLLKMYDPILEVGAGSGYWSKLLKAEGVDVVATDICEMHWQFGIGRHLPVLNLDAEVAVRKYPNRSVFMSWPSLDDPWSYNAAKAMGVGRHLIYIGEGRGGCTASEQFFDLMQADFEYVEHAMIPQFPGINDHLFVYKRVKG